MVSLVVSIRFLKNIFLKIFQCFIIIFFIQIISSTPVIKKKINHASGIISIIIQKYFILLKFLELITSNEDKHCYTCKGADDDCITPCHWTQRCYIKARHANATSLFIFFYKISNYYYDDDVFVC